MPHKLEPYHIGDDWRDNWKDPDSLVKEFHRAFGHPIINRWDPAHVPFRLDLINEEVDELYEACNERNPDAIAKELADLVYVVYGMASSCGINLPLAVFRTHLSNMSKLDDNGKPIYREDGKVLKGPNYRPPSMKGTY